MSPTGGGIVDHAALWAAIHAETFAMEEILRVRARAIEERKAALASDERVLAEDRIRIFELRRVAAAYMRGGKPTEMRLPDSGTRLAGRLKGKEILETAHDVLEKEGRPMTRRRIADEIERIHGRVASRDLTGHVGMLLWTDKERFVSVGRAGYALVGWGTPDVSKALKRRRRVDAAEEE